jgi:hypothetical protein
MGEQTDKSKLIIAIFITIIFINLGVLYWLIIDVRAGVLGLDLSDKNTAQESKPKLETVVVEDYSDSALCPQSCENQINSLKKTVAKITPVPATVTDNKTENTAQPTDTALIKENTILLGNSKVTATDWGDIPGLNAYIDSNNYKNIKSVNYEISARIPTANDKIYTRLYNSTAKQVVWQSEINTDSIDSIVLSSENINLSGGNNLYQVQAKTDFGRDTFIDAARIKIFLK